MTAHDDRELSQALENLSDDDRQALLGALDGGAEEQSNGR